jgi:hypothetical protein
MEPGAGATGDQRSAVLLDSCTDLAGRRPLEAVAEDAAKAGDVVADDVLPVNDDSRA